MVRPLPVRPSLTHARNEAKAILRAHRRKERGCCAVLRHLKKLGDASDDQILATELTLADVQYALAVDYGYASWAKLKVRVEQSAPPILVHPPMRWFHGSPYRLATLRPGSTVTPIVELARAFAHGPARVNINIREDDIAPNRSVVIEHNGKREGLDRKSVV